MVAQNEQPCRTKAVPRAHLQSSVDRPGGLIVFLSNHYFPAAIAHTIYQKPHSYTEYNWAAPGSCCKKHLNNFPHQDNPQSSFPGKIMLLTLLFLPTINFFERFPPAHLYQPVSTRWRCKWHTLHNLE